MAQHRLWWMLPGACIVLARIVTLDEAVPVGIPAAVAGGPQGLVAVEDAVGRRRGPVQSAGLAEGELRLIAPPGLAGQRATVTLWRKSAGRRQAAPHLVLRRSFLADGSLPITGLGTGSYDVEVVAAGGQRFGVTSVGVPGWVGFVAGSQGR